MLLILQILIVGTVVVPGLSCPLSVKVYDSSSKLASVAMEGERVGEGRRERERVRKGGGERRERRGRRGRRRGVYWRDRQRGMEGGREIGKEERRERER